MSVGVVALRGGSALLVLGLLSRRALGPLRRLVDPSFSPCGYWVLAPGFSFVSSCFGIHMGLPVVLEFPCQANCELGSRNPTW